MAQSRTELERKRRERRRSEGKEQVRCWVPREYVDWYREVAEHLRENPDRPSLPRLYATED